MHNIVKDYYGNVLSGSEDLQTNACCTDDNLSTSLKSILSNIHDEVMTRYYGCGLVTPELLKDCHVLDLGCGAGRDCYAIAQMVGENGFVTGVDMTDEQLAVANQHSEYHREKFGYAKANTKFLKGYIEKLDELNIADNSIDVVVSNCVINLSPDKHAVLKEIFRILKPGGEIYFSDVYADKRVPANLVEDPLLYGECLSGALYWNDFENLAKTVGFTEPRLVSSRAITIDNDDLAQRLGDLKFTSATYRLFKAQDLENQGQDYGQTVTYQGTIPEHEQGFSLDQNTQFAANQPTKVNGNTWRTLEQSRFKAHFVFEGNFEKHQGIFDNSDSVFDFINTDAGGCCPDGSVETSVEKSAEQSSKQNTNSESSSCCAPKAPAAKAKTSCC